MNTRPSTIPATFVLVLLALLSGPATAGIKCWTNSEGVKECGNTVPPEYAQQGHTEVNEQGITTGTTDRAKTSEELAAERQATAEQQERDRLAKEQADRDRVLLDTFTTEDDLILARDGKLAAIDTRIRHTQQTAADLNVQLSQLEEEAANQERSGKALDDELLANITAVQSQLEENSMFIAEREREKDELRAKFEQDLVRYRELKGM